MLNPFATPTLYGPDGKPVGERAAEDKTANVERGNPGELRYDGVLAGLHGRSESGDVNDLANHTFFCPVCGAALGVAARWRPDANGMRGVRCMAVGPDGKVCDHVTCLDASMRVVKVAPGREWDTFVKARMVSAAHEDNGGERDTY